ncbi:IclR family transcriptional regulator [Shouchella lehensis]|uniref:IclR family transcriptional regulator n=1 Tax=Shouchella lehensis TaxID=300825 RepID=A0A4Y7WK15_9BACI|nr:IclR family transcriptional regulator [Shouchella lehensis]MBG9785913.1 IclR family transcriptional regulator [Shouchella lehensis]TES48388.1 IclR family transcriptional regulator [Shouchella lehensis]
MTVKSAVRVLRIFELLSTYKKGLTIKQISTFLQFPQSSTSALMKTLVHENYVTIQQHHLYVLGPRLIPIGQAALESVDLLSVATPSLKQLQSAVRETVFMATLVKGELIYLAKIDSDRSIHTSAYLGAKSPLYCTGLGKVYLAFMEENERNNYLESMILEPITDRTITSKKDLAVCLATYQIQGYAMDDEEHEEGLVCFAAPIFGNLSSIEAAVSVAGPKERMIKQKLSIIERLKETATRISSNLGYK